MKPPVSPTSPPRRLPLHGARYLACLAAAALLAGTPAHAQEVSARIDSIFSFATAETVPAPATTPAPPLEGRVGEYEMPGGRSITITLEGGQLHGEPTGGPKPPLAHVSGATFGVGRADAPVTVTFTLGADGRATAMLVRRNGNERTLPRVP